MFNRGRTEQRRSGGVTGSLSYGSGHYAGVTPREGESLNAVCACIELIAGSIASLPAELVQDTADGSIPAPATASAWRVIRRPNRWQSWPAYMGWLVGSHLLFGNAASWIQMDARGAVNALVPMPWPWLTVQGIAGQDGPRIAYDVMAASPEAMLLGLPPRLFDDEVLHIRARSDLGAIGRSVLSRAPAAMREGLTIATLAQRNWDNGSRPSMVFEVEKFLPEPQRKRFEEETREKLVGAINSGGWALLEGGMKAKGLSLSSVDAEFLGTRHFSVSEVCRLYGVPEQLVQPANRAIADLTPYLSTFATMALQPVVTLIEAEMDVLLPPGVHLRLDMSALMRGSFSAATSAMAALVGQGIISPNDARLELGWRSRPDGDALRVSASPNYPADFTGSTAHHPSPGPAGDQPQPPSHNNTGAKRNGSAVLQ